VKYFTPVARCLYLTATSVDVGSQGKGLGRLALVDAVTKGNSLVYDEMVLG